MPIDGQPDQKTTSDQEPTVAADPAAEATQVVNTAPLAQDPPYAGVKIKDRYQIERELGRGGFGIVYLAKDEQLHSRLVVIKVLLEKQSADSAWFTKKFRQEREALSRIDHPGIVGVLDAGEMPDGKPFLVMQYVDGLTLRSAMKNQQFPLPRIAQIVGGIGQALAGKTDTSDNWKRCPAAAVQPIQGAVTWWVDQVAAKLIETSVQGGLQINGRQA